MMIRSVRGAKVLILLGTLAFLAIGYCAPFSGAPSPMARNITGSLAGMAHDAASYEQLKAGRAPADLPPPLLRFNGYALPRDSLSGTFFYSVIEGLPDASNPRVTLENAGSDYRLAFQDVPITPETIRQNRKHFFLLYNDTHYAEFSFAVTTLPIVLLNSAAPATDGDAFINGKRKSAVELTLFDNSSFAAPSQRVMTNEAGIRVRGATTRHQPQKSYRVFLSYLSLGHNQRKHAASLLGMRLDEDWILYSPYSEPDKLRNIMATNLWWAMGADNNGFGVKNGTQGRYVELFINGRYQGVYGLMPPVDWKQLRLRATDDPQTTEYFYRKISNTKAVSHYFNKRLHRNYHLGFELRFPKHPGNTFAKWAPLAEYLQILGGSDDVYRQRFKNAVAIENAIDLWLFVNATMAVDNIEKNISYIAKRDGHGYVMLFSPWDLDQVWGYGWSGDHELFTTVPGSFDKGLWIHEEMPLGRALLLNADNIWEKVARRYAALRQSALSDASMEALFAEHEQNVYGSGAILRNHGRWPQAGYTEDAAGLRVTMLRRLADMDREIERISRNPAGLHPSLLPFGAQP